MAKRSFEKVSCPKCGRVYAVLKGYNKAFHCPGSNCHEMVKPTASAGSTADASAKANG